MHRSLYSRLKGMLLLLLFLIVTVTGLGCSSIQARIGVTKAQHRKLIVREINWKETATSEIEGEQMTEFVSSQPMLSELFRSVFDKYMKEAGVFDAIAYGDAQADSDTLILIPKIYTLKPTGFMPGASYTGLLLSADGKLIGKYSEERRLNSTDRGKTKMKSNIEDLIKDLAEDAASKLPYPRAQQP